MNKHSREGEIKSQNTNKYRKMLEFISNQKMKIKKTI